MIQIILGIIVALFIICWLDVLLPLSLATIATLFYGYLIYIPVDYVATKLGSGAGGLLIFAAAIHVCWVWVKFMKCFFES